MSEVLRERLSTLYAAVKLGQIDFVLNSINDDEYISYAPVKVFPFLGHHRGKSGDVFGVTRSDLAFDFVSCEPVSMVIEADHAAAIIFARAVNRATGRSVQGMLAHFMRFHNGKLIEIREFMDSFSAVEQTLGARSDRRQLSGRRNKGFPPARHIAKAAPVHSFIAPWLFCIHSRSPICSTRS
jgi:ketosteroid isomerase-like protein